MDHVTLNHDQVTRTTPELALLSPNFHTTPMGERLTTLTDLTCISPRYTGQGLNPGEGMDVCKCIVPVRHGGTRNIHPAASPLVRLVEGEERFPCLNWGGGVAIYHLFGEFRRANSYCHLYAAHGQGQRHAYLESLATMNIVPLDLITSDR
ncbi:hypothetical protein TNCV_2763841 [Trichonephila clavipes]|nr:hypothetical protein TNCV_2763841 [Trichonephila clavipes]